MIDRIKSELIAKRDELRRKNNLRSLEEVVDEKKATPKRKIVFKKKE